ncbi:hypothetical protein ARMA_0389 [Ardenticatena maritima]|uniref:Uncharacterized protein n=1 Tax=Ardenticatena maritima TaxID=872965 RepID=A0A0M8K7L3_9CHLR|nr:hypothetical protein ARMA_0389 [Ardenticatena maritima]
MNAHTAGDDGETSTSRNAIVSRVSKGKRKMSCETVKVATPKNQACHVAPLRRRHQNATASGPSTTPTSSTRKKSSSIDISHEG